MAQGMDLPQLPPDSIVQALPSALPAGGTFDLRSMTEDPQQVSLGLKLLALLTVLAMVPSFLMMVTSFTRIVVVLSFVRRAMGVNEVPPTPVILGLALFLTFFVMAPVLTEINEIALQPYLNEEIGPGEALGQAEGPLREFMMEQTRRRDLALFVRLSRIDPPATPEDVPFHVLVPAFMISELKTAFTIGFMIYIPFLVIDMVVSSILLSMGMLMLPPILISLPFKVILFVLVDGWNLIIGSLIAGYM
ncbi:flagellar type III secretion system pore protein FliP [Candidatus Sumerlaeota bacterium]|nr:flagellar type III secretion system pore protein FliP [Candidatus Sumerlaeota bacterium]